MPQTIVTRFAPSPTGYLHIGGARTALFNWLYARGIHGQGAGKFLLRIEDTDRARHNEAAVNAIIEGLSWLGLDWDGDPISQYARRDRHAEIAFDLLDKDMAYRCWLEGEELAAERALAKAEGRRVESPWRDADKSTSPNRPFAIRLRAPQSGTTTVKDLIQGPVSFRNEDFDDVVLLRSDGTPTYMLAVVVDDHDMGITHIVRGDDHLINAGRQQQIYEALGWNIPHFAHMPLIHGADGAKLSKRHGALGVESYRDMGYLPETLRNYLLRLGWSHGDDEIISTENALKWFDVKDINKAPSRLDLDKMSHLNAHYIQQMDDAAFLQQGSTFLEESQRPLSPIIEERLQRGCSFIKSRCKTLADFPQAGAFLLTQRPLKIEGKSAKPLRKDGALQMLGHVVVALEEVPSWSVESLDAKLADLAQTLGVGFGQIGPPARAALTAGLPSPNLGEVLYALGREEALDRLKDCL